MYNIKVLNFAWEKTTVYDSSTLILPIHNMLVICVVMTTKQEKLKKTNM